MPSRLGMLLDVKSTALQQVIYFQRYIVTESGDTPLKVGELFSEEQYREALGKYGDNFTALMGAESVRELLKKIDLPVLEKNLRLSLLFVSRSLNVKT